MELFNIPKKHINHYVLVALFFVFIVLPVKVPVELAKLVDTSLGKIVVTVMVISLLLLNPVLGVVGSVAAYELIRRSSGHTSLYSGLNSQFIPSEKSKISRLNKFNQFPYTVEEYIINRQIPYSFNVSDVGLENAPFKPLNSDKTNSVNVR